MGELRTSDKALDRVFDEQEQAAIIATAAALQRDQSLQSTLSDLERAALEAGIEPRFVREAVRLQHAPPVEAAIVETSQSSDHIWRSAMSAAIFVPAEIAALSWNHDHLHSGWGALVVAVLFVLALPRRSYARWVAVVWPMVVAMSITVFDPFVSVKGVLLLAVMQGAIALAVNLLASPRPSGASNALTNRSRNL